MNHRAGYRKWLKLVSISLCCQFSGVAWSQEQNLVQLASSEQDLYLTIELNRSAQSAIGHFQQRGNSLFIHRESLKKLNLQLSSDIETTPDEFVRLDDIKGLQYRYLAAEQRIQLMVTSELLDSHEQVIGYDPPQPAVIDPSQTRPGVLFNYDVYGQHNHNSSSISAWNELRLWGLSEGSILSISANHLFIDNDTEHSYDSTILDTYWKKDFQNKSISLLIGDGQSKALDWTRSTRISGLKLSKNFDLQPYQVSSTLESFKGSVLLPSSVDLLINGVKQSTSQVQPGQFNLQALPSITGAGDTQLVITDMNGQERIVNISLFGTVQLLRQGFSDWDFNLGVNKLDYDLKSVSYDHDLVANGSYRYGFTQNTTLESHTELASDLQMAGLGIIQRLPNRLGLLNASYSYSNANDENGQNYRLGYQWSNRYVNFSSSHQQATEHFNDIASTLDYSFIRKSDQAFIGVSTPYGQFGSSYAKQKYDESETELLILNWSHVFPSRKYLNFSMTRDLNNQENTFYLSLNIPLDRQTTANIYTQHDQDNTQYAINAKRTAAQDRPDWGWQANANFTDSQNYIIQAQVQRQNNYGEWNLGLQDSEMNGINYTTGMASARGSLVMMDKGIFAMRQSLGSFAVISADGMADVPVQLENRSVGKTNKKGLLLVKDLNAYQHNMLSIDALGLPVDYKIEKTRIDAVPHSGSGVYIKFPLYRIKTVQMNVVDASGKIFPLGSRVWNQNNPPLEGQKETTIVARDGLVYLESPTSPHIYIELNGQYCHLTLPDLKDRYGFIDLGNLTCQ